MLSQNGLSLKGKFRLFFFKAVLSLIYRRLLVVILCCKSPTIKVDVRLCLGNKNVDTPIEGDLASTRLEFSMALLGTRLWWIILPFIGLILLWHSSYAVNLVQGARTHSRPLQWSSWLKFTLFLNYVTRKAFPV